MNNMLYKEFKLAMHPTSIIFLSLSAMMLIPNYPYYMTFFYTTLAIFFTCLSGRENHDIFYAMTLPIRKRDLPGNLVGMDANIAFFGLSFLMMGFFNLVFFTKYYKDTDKVGKSFLMGTIVITLFMIIAEASVHVVPFFKNYLDTKDPQFLTYKIIVLAAGIILYSALTFLSYQRSVRSFEALDL